MNDLERYLWRQKQLRRWGWLMVILFASFVLAVAMLLKEALDLLGGGK